MKMSPTGRAALMAREGRRLTAYRDSVGVPTIGIGFTEIYGRKVRMGDVLTAAECDALFEPFLAKYEAAVTAALKASVSQNAFDAVASVTYNIGIAAMQGSTFVRRINAGDLAGAKAAILMWQKPAAIVTRRQAEAEQFATPYAVRLPSPTKGAKAIVVAPSDQPVTPIAVPSATPIRDALGRLIAAAFPGSGHVEVGAAKAA